MLKAGIGIIEKKEEKKKKRLHAQSGYRHNRGKTVTMRDSEKDTEDEEYHTCGMNESSKLLSELKPTL